MDSVKSFEIELQGIMLKKRYEWKLKNSELTNQERKNKFIIEYNEITFDPRPNIDNLIKGYIKNVWIDEMDVKYFTI